MWRFRVSPINGVYDAINFKINKYNKLNKLI